jgi:ABC-type bacteriocin/lantibiotic exporter with double-glycine peptidase domain
MRTECKSCTVSKVLKHVLLTPHTLHSYFIKEGKVSESGTHDQLLAKRGDYYEFVQLQALSKR